MSYRKLYTFEQTAIWLQTVDESFGFEYFLQDVGKNPVLLHRISLPLYSPITTSSLVINPDRYTTLVSTLDRKPERKDENFNSSQNVAIIKSLQYDVTK